MKTQRGRPRRYDWIALFARRKFTLLRGRDYHCSHISMAQQIRNAASDLKLHVRVAELRGGIEVEIDGEKQQCPS